MCAVNLINLEEHEMNILSPFTYFANTNADVAVPANRDCGLYDIPDKKN